MKSHILTLCRGSFCSNLPSISVGILSTRENWHECLRDLWRRVLLLAKAVLVAPGCATVRGENREGKGESLGCSCCVCVAEGPGVRWLQG